MGDNSAEGGLAQREKEIVERVHQAEGGGKEKRDSMGAETRGPPQHV